MKVVNHLIKGRQEALKKASEKTQYGLGLVVTNLMCAVIFWRWSWTIWDRRAK